VTHGPGVRLVAVEPGSREEWDAYVAADPRGDILQSWAWGEVAARRAERPRRLAVRGPDGRLQAVAQVLVRPTRFGRSVLYVPHGPLWDRGGSPSDEAALLGGVLDGLRQLAEAERGIVLKIDPRGDGATEQELEALRQTLMERGLRPARRSLQASVTQVIELLDGGEALRKTWHSLARRNVSRSAREGVVTRTVRHAEPAAIAEFHRIHAETASRAGFQGRSLAFLEGVAAEFAPRGGWYLCLASKDGQVVGGMVALRIGERGYYLYGASTRDPAMKEARAGYAAMAGIMGALAADGARTLDTWGIAEGESDEAGSWGGFSFFKQRFGGNPVRHAGTFDLVVSPGWHAVRDLAERARGWVGRA